MFSRFDTIPAVTDTQPPSHVAVAITLNAKASSLKTQHPGNLTTSDLYYNRFSQLEKPSVYHTPRRPQLQFYDVIFSLVIIRLLGHWLRLCESFLSKVNMWQMLHVGSVHQRIDPFCFLAGCCKSTLNQLCVSSLLYLTSFLCGLCSTGVTFYSPSVILLLSFLTSLSLFCLSVRLSVTLWHCI